MTNKNRSILMLSWGGGQGVKPISRSEAMFNPLEGGAL